MLFSKSTLTKTLPVILFGILIVGVVVFATTIGAGLVTESLTLTTPLAVTSGGTGAATASAARTALGLVIGTNVQAWDADLDSWAGISPSAKAGSGANTDITSIGGNDNSATSWRLLQGSDNYILLDTTDSAEALTFGNATTNPAYTFLGSGLLNLNGLAEWDTGRAITAAAYQIGRDADATNQLHFNVPTGATFEFSVNDAAELALNATNLQPGANDGLALGVSGTAFSDLFLASGGVIDFAAGDMTITHATNALTFAGGNYSLTQAVATSGSPAGLTFTGGAHTTLAASTEAIDVNFNLARTVQFATGALTTQRAFVIQAPTYGFVGASDLDFAITLAITGAPQQGTNATITSSTWGQFIGAISGTSAYASGSVNHFGTSVPGISNDTGEVSNRIGVVIGDNFNKTAVSLGNQTAELSNFIGLNIETIAVDSTTNVRTINFAAGADIGLISASSANVIVNNEIGLRVRADTTWNQKDAGSYLAGIQLSDAIITLGKTTQLTNATAAIAPIYVGQYEIDQSAGATTVNNSASLYIAGPLIAGPSVTLTNNYAVWVDAGASRFDGAIIGSQGTDIASASTIVIPRDGNTFELTGTTAVNLITTTGYQDGHEITLVSNENVTITNGTATSGANVTILLAAAGNFAMTANDTLTLRLSSTTAGGQAWREVARSVN